MSLVGPKRIVVDYEPVNVHLVNGDLRAIRFLRDADDEWVEGLFFQAKHTGHVEFAVEGVRYTIVRNRNLTYTVSELVERATDVESL